MGSSEEKRRQHNYDAAWEASTSRLSPCKQCKQCRLFICNTQICVILNTDWLYTYADSFPVQRRMISWYSVRHITGTSVSVDLAREVIWSSAVHTISTFVNFELIDHARTGEAESFEHVRIYCAQKVFVNLCQFSLLHGEVCIKIAYITWWFLFGGKNNVFIEYKMSFV